MQNKKTEVLSLGPYPVFLSPVHISTLQYYIKYGCMQEIQKDEEMISLHCSVRPWPSRSLKLHDGVIILFLVSVGEKEV